VFEVCHSLVAEEYAALGATPVPLDFFAKEQEGDEVCCGAAPSFEPPGPKA